MQTTEMLVLLTIAKTFTTVLLDPRFSHTSLSSIVTSSISFVTWRVKESDVVVDKLIINDLKLQNTKQSILLTSASLFFAKICEMINGQI